MTTSKTRDTDGHHRRSLYDPTVVPTLPRSIVISCNLSLARPKRRTKRRSVITRVEERKMSSVEVRSNNGDGPRVQSYYYDLGANRRSDEPKQIRNRNFCLVLIKRPEWSKVLSRSRYVDYPSLGRRSQSLSVLFVLSFSEELNKCGDKTWGVADVLSKSSHGTYSYVYTYVRTSWTTISYSDAYGMTLSARLLPRIEKENSYSMSR